MPRPKTVLWVDDEVESLAAHVLFLQEHGYEVEQAAQGDDALALLQRRAYGVILLDEQMPGRQGLELVASIRAVDSAVPIVMVTKSEEAGTMQEAIGIELDDYLVKPVNPRQVLSVVTKLLEGDRIRQQRLARDFVIRFRELEQRRGDRLGWREWIDLVVEMYHWDARLGPSDESGLKDALHAFERSLHADFAEFFAAQYPNWLANPGGDRPPLSVDVCSEFLVPLLRAHRRVMFVVVDCLRLDQWELMKPAVTQLFDLEESHYYSIVPSATPFSRNAIFSGLYPLEIQARHPEWWGEHDDESLNAHEAELFAEQMRDLMGGTVPTQYEKVASASEAESLLRRIPGYLSRDGATALVFNFIDQLTHGRAENPVLYEVARNSAALRAITKTWFQDSALYGALKEAERRGVPVLLTTDHGSIHCRTPATVFAKRDATANLRYKFGEDLRAENRSAAIEVQDLRAWGLPKMRLGVRLLLAAGDHFFVYPTKLREYQARYRGSFLHGGISPEEVILPVALLTPRA
ncbi:MAG TPA: response regulator [Gemmatimonadales bacterium]|jgi:CheY-like chemotaxis protein